MTRVYFYFFASLRRATRAICAGQLRGPFGPVPLASRSTSVRLATSRGSSQTGLVLLSRYQDLIVRSSSRESGHSYGTKQSANPSHFLSDTSPCLALQTSDCFVCRDFKPHPYPCPKLFGYDTIGAECPIKNAIKGVVHFSLLAIFTHLTLSPAVSWINSCILPLLRTLVSHASCDLHIPFCPRLKSRHGL